MTSNTLIILLLIGLSAGAFAGLLGIGGGLILIPALVYFIGMNQHEAIGTSLAVMLPPIGLFAAYNFYKAGQINIKYALILALAFMVGSYFSSKFALTIPANLLRKIFSFFLIAVGIKMLFTK